MMSALKRKSRPGSDPLPVYDLTGGGAAPQGAFVAVVPGEVAPMIPLDLPPKLKGQARDRVARRQLRDAFGGAEPTIDIRPAHIGAQPDLWTRVLVVDRDARLEWVRRLGAAADRCRGVIPDYIALPAAPELWVIRTDGPRVLARLGLEDGFAAEPGLAEALLETAIKSPPRAILRLGPPEPGIDAMLARLSLPLCSTVAEVAAHGLSTPMTFEHGEMSLDLSRDPGAERAKMRRSLRRLSLPLALAVLGFAGWIAATVIETRTLADQGMAFRRNAERMLRDTMIPTGPILDIRSQVSQRLERARKTSTETVVEARPLDVLRRAGAILGRHSPRVTRVSYQPGSGLVLDLQIDDFAALDALVSDLREGGTGARIAQSETRDDGDGVEAVIAMTVRIGGQRP